jgi:hypothetical protein
MGIRPRRALAIIHLDGPCPTDLADAPGHLPGPGNGNLVAKVLVALQGHYELPGNRPAAPPRRGGSSGFALAIAGRFSSGGFRLPSASDIRRMDVAASPGRLLCCRSETAHGILDGLSSVCRPPAQARLVFPRSCLMGRAKAPTHLGQDRLGGIREGGPGLPCGASYYAGIDMANEQVYPGDVSFHDIEFCQVIPTEAVEARSGGPGGQGRRRASERAPTQWRPAQRDEWLETEFRRDEHGGCRRNR